MDAGTLAEVRRLDADMRKLTQERDNLLQSWPVRPDGIGEPPVGEWEEATRLHELILGIERDIDHLLGIDRS
jgi:hypothetical protein